MTDTIIEKGEEKTNPIDGTQPSDEGKTPEPSQKKSKYTEKEKAEYVLKSTAERLKNLGGNPAEVLNIHNAAFDEEFSDDTPLTVGHFRKLQKQEIKKTSLQLADSIEDEDEREEVKNLLHRLSPSDDSRQDLAVARSAVNAKRTQMLAEEAERKREANRTAAGSSSPMKKQDEFEPTKEELELFKGFNLSPEKFKEKILKAREKAQQ